MNIKHLLFLCVGGTVLLASCGGIASNGVTAKTDGSAYNGAMFNETDGVSVGYSGLVLYTDDGGKTWNRGTNKSVCLFASDAIDAQNFIATGNGGNVIKTADGGKTWQRKTSITGSQGKSVSFADTGHGWVSSRTWLGETVDGGQTWTTLTLPEGVTFIETINFSAPGTGYLLSEKGVLFRTNNGGTNWEKLAAPIDTNPSFKPVLGKNIQHAAFRFKGDLGVMAVIGMKGKEASLMVLRTKDAGKSWETREIAKQKGTPLSVYISPDSYVSVFNADSTIAKYKL